MAAQPPTTAIEESIPAADRVHSTRTVYDASPGEIFWRHFLAGASRALGGIVVYLIFLGVMAYFVSVYILPRFMPFLNTFTSSMDMLNSMQQQQQQLSPLLYGTSSGGAGTSSSGGLNTLNGSTTQQYQVPSAAEVEELYQLYLQTQSPGAQP